MYTTLGPEAIGIRGLSLAEAIDLARGAGFAGLSFDIRAAADAVDEHGPAAVRELFDRAGVRPAHWNLPLDWRKRVAFWAELEPNQMNRFDCLPELSKKKPKARLKPRNGKITFKTKDLLVVINTKTANKISKCL